MGSAPRVCIVTPGQIGSNPRVVKEAQALHEAGYEVSVIATRTLDLVEPRDLALMRRIPWRLERIDLRSRVRWRLLRTAQLAARRVHAATGLARSAEAGLSAFVRPLRRTALETPANLYVAHYPAALPAAAAAATKYDAHYAYDAEDFHLGDWPDDAAYDIERRLVREIESRYLPGCVYVTTSSPGIADAYAETYGIERPHVVLNAFPVGRASHGPTTRGTAQPGPSLYWFSQTIGPNRGIECAVWAVGLARTLPHLYLRGTPVAGYAERVLHLAETAGAGGRVHLLAPDEPDKMEQLAAAYDVGLVAETGHTASRRLCLTNKLFSFLVAGIPPLMSDTPAHCRFAAEAGLTDLIYPGEDPAALAGLLDRLLGDETRLADGRGRTWRLGQERYNWERERGQLVEAAVGRVGLGPAVVGPLNTRAVPDVGQVADEDTQIGEPIPMRPMAMTIRDLGLAIARTAPWLDQVGRWVYARLPESLHDTPTSRLRAHSASALCVTFVQIGAYDGVAGDPIRSLVLEDDRWCGVMVEPQPDVFDRLRRNYLAQASRLQFLNAAISDRSGEKTLFCISEAERKQSGLPHWSSEVASFNAEHLRKHFPHAKLVSCSVKTMTFAEVADRLPGGHVDVVVIDVEGHERTIIESIDLKRHRVKIIVYEHKHLSESDRLVVESKLRGHGFSLKGFGRDTIAFRPLQPVDQLRPLAADEVVR